MVAPAYIVWLAVFFRVFINFLTFENQQISMNESLWDNFPSCTFRIYTPFHVYFNTNYFLKSSDFTSKSRLPPSLPHGGLYSTRAPASSCLLHKRHAPPFSCALDHEMLLAGSFPHCVPAPCVGVQASFLHVLQTLTSHCLLAVPWVLT